MVSKPEELINTALDTSRKPFVARGGNSKSTDSESNEKALVKRSINT